MQSKGLKVTARYIFLFILIGFCAAASAQFYNQELDDFEPDAKKRDKLGIRIGFGFNTLKSDELVNTRYTRGYQGAFYYRVNLFKGFHLNPEFGASIRGSRHKNGDVGYTQFSLLYFDLSMLSLIQLEPTFRHNLVLGVQASRLMRSSLFVGKEQFPGFLQLPFKPYDYAAVIGYHFNTNYVGFQLCVKYGLRNIAKDFSTYNRKSFNSSLEFVDITPSLRGVKDVRNFNIELSMYF